MRCGCFLLPSRTSASFFSFAGTFPKGHKQHESEHESCGDSMMDEQEFRRRADAALAALKAALITAEETAEMEVEDQAGALHISFDEPPGRFVISPNAPVRQIWISALSTSFKLDWSDAAQGFVLEKTGEGLKPLVARLINEQLGEESVTLS